MDPVTSAHNGTELSSNKQRQKQQQRRSTMTSLPKSAAKFGCLYDNTNNPTSEIVRNRVAESHWNAPFKGMNWVFKGLIHRQFASEQSPVLILVDNLIIIPYGNLSKRKTEACGREGRAGS